ncbi:MAG: NADH-ubiquinone oxidoreductase-F iron-sulfur binding region domain-containing protein [Acidimicrobiales bacterium]
MADTAFGAPPDRLPRLLAGVRGEGRHLSLEEHLAVHGPLPRLGRSSPDRGLIDLIGRAGLRGRGGADFPTAVKMLAVAGGRERASVVVNGSESEPASAKDAALLRGNPHLVLDGAALAAHAVGAVDVIVAVHAREVTAVRSAVAERASRGWDSVTPAIAAMREGFVSGQETAAVSFLNGGNGLPTFAPPRVAERGIGGRPTLVSNVETLAHIALIARHGAEWFRGLGTADEPGSTLLTLGGAVSRPGVYEAARGAPLSGVIEQAGGATGSIQAFLIGGYEGAWVPASPGRDIALSEAGLSREGGTLGVGLILVLPADACGLTETARIVGFLAGESAGQCGPCVHGLPALAKGMAELARGQARAEIVDRLAAWSWQVTGRGACHHPDGVARLVTSALRTFAADAADHARRQPCAAATRAKGSSRARVG